MSLLELKKLRQYFTVRPSPAQSQDSESSLRRRDLLLLVAATPPTLSERLRIRREQYGVVLEVGKGLSWRIESRWFGSGARLQIEERDDRIHLELSDAVYPGTGLPASFRATIEQAWRGWWLNLEHEAFLEPAGADFVAWLSGRASLSGSPIRVPDPWHVEFARSESWNLGPALNFSWGEHHLRLPDGSRLRGVRGGVTPAISESMLFGGGRLSSKLWVERGGEGWHVEPDWTLPADWTLKWSEDSFSRASLELFGDGADWGLVLENELGQGSAILHTPQAASNLSLPLERPRYVIARRQDERESWFQADWAAPSTRVHLPYASFELGPSAKPLEIVASAGEVARIDGAPSLTSWTTSLGDTSLQVRVTTTPGTCVQLVPDVKASWLRGLACYLGIEADCHAYCLPLPGQEMEVFRAADQLHLRICFTNFKMVSHGGEPFLEKDDPKAVSYLLFTLPPQSFLEEFFEKTTGGTACAPGGVQPQTTSPPVRTLMAKVSRVVLQWPRPAKPGSKSESPRLPLRLDALLNWSSPDFALSVDPRAVPGGVRPDEASTTMGPVGEQHTMIEAPYRLHVSPASDAKFAVSRPGIADPLGPCSALPAPQSTAKEWDELWNARLVGPDGNSPPSVRALFTPGYDPNLLPPHLERPFVSPLTHSDRVQIVDLTSNFKLIDPRLPLDNSKYLALPVTATSFLLTPHGASFHVEGKWQPPIKCGNSPVALDLEEWSHTLEQGFDDKVSVVYRGFLLPFGLRAVVFERSFRELGARAPDHPNSAVAYGRKVLEIKYRDQDEVLPDGKHTVMTFPGVGHTYRRKNGNIEEILGARSFPYRSVVIERGFKTPLLDFPPNDGPGKPNRDITMFWPTVGCQDFLFPATLVDLAGREIPIRIPMYFISVSVAYTDPSWVTTISKLCGDSGITQQPTGWMPGMSLDDARKFYNEDSECRNVININNTVAYASARTSGDTSFETQQQTLRVEQTVYTATDDGIEFFRRNKLPAHPSVALATCRVAAVEQLTGVNEPVKALYFSSYLQKGFDAGSNSGEVYLKFATGVPMNFSGTSNVADRSGGVITPNASLVGLSRKSGPVGGSSTANVTESSLSISARGEFNPEEYFRGALEAARLLGGVLLTDVLKAVTGDLASGLGGAPKILRRLYAFGADKFLTAAKIAQAALATLFAKVQNTPGGGFRRRFEPLLDRLAVDISTLESIPAQPEDGDLTLDALESIQKSIQLQERVVADFRSIVDTATALANNPRQLAEEELGAWLDQLESQFFQLSSVNDAINALVTVLIKIDDTQNLVGRLLVDAQNKLIDDLTSEVASGIVAPIAQRAISGAILIGKRVQQKFAEAGGWNAAEKAVEKGLTIAADAAQAVEELRAALRLISDLLDAASRDPGGFVVAVLHLTGLDQIPEITKILDWRARAEVAYQAVLDTIQADTDRAANLTRLWIRFRSIHVRIETEFKSLRAEVQRMVQSPSDPSYRAAVVQRLGRVQALQREFAAAVLEFDQFLHTLIEAIATARVRRNVAVDLSALAGEVDVLRQLLLEGIHSFALVTAATVAGIKQNLRDAWGAMTIPMTTIGDRIGAVFTNYQQKLIASLDVLPSNPGIDDIPKFVDVINAATDASSFFSLFGEVENAAAALKMRMRTIRADLDSAMALAKTLYPGVRTLNDKLLAVANAAPALLKQALVNEVNKAARPLSDALTAYTNDRLDELASLLSQVLAILFSALTEVLSRVEPTLDGLLDLLATATEIRKQLAELLAVRRIEVSFAWTPEMKAGPADLAIFEPRDPVEDEDPELPHCQIDSRIQIMLPSGERRASLVGTLRRFNLNLLTKSTHFITVDFHSLQFRSVNGSAPDCKVDIHEVRFGGDLSFLDSIRKYLSPDQGPFLEFRDNAIVAGFRFALPPIDTGGMTIRDARLEFAISIPFNGEPVRFRFGLSRKSDPFVVAITLMGGGGWFALGIGADGVDLIDIGIEAGLAGSISVGPVSGFGRIMVGVFLRKDASKGTTLGGFVDIFGKVSVIGISVTLIANLTLSYNFQARLAEGDVEVIIRISLWLVDIEFRFHVHREFSTSGGATGILTRPSVKGFSAIPGADLVDEPRVGARNVVHEMNWPVYEEALMEL